MLDIDQPKLNQGQKDAAEGFFNFLLTDQPEMIISGAGGTGKTFLMGHLINEIMPRYEKMCQMMGIDSEFDSVIMTATTNKAAEVLAIETGRPTETIHSFLRLTVKEDWATGETKLTRTERWTIHQRMIIFIDECPMIDGDLHKMIREGTHNCKIIYVGDSYQLGPVGPGNSVSPIYNHNLPYFELTEPMRNNGQPALMNLCNQLRETVRTQQFGPIQLVPNVIDHVEADEMMQLIQQLMIGPGAGTANARILAFTNSRVQDYNDYIRSQKNLPIGYSVGERLINNNVTTLPGRSKLYVEQEVTIVSMGPLEELELYDKTTIEVHFSTIQTSLGTQHYRVPIPADPLHLNKLLKFYANQKQWRVYFQLKETIPDFRPRDASTIHKSQGSSFNTVFLDLENLSTCNMSNMVSRLLYVGLSRARNRVILYGKLSPRYGSIIQ